MAMLLVHNLRQAWHFGADAQRLLPRGLRVDLQANASAFALEIDGLPGSRLRTRSAAGEKPLSDYAALPGSHFAFTVGVSITIPREA
jgi:hypothetical protein